jgi:hypothetical protein
MPDTTIEDLKMSQYTQSDELTVLPEPFVQGLGEIHFAWIPKDAL